MLKDLRKNKNLTQQQAASLIGVRQTAIAAWEKGSSLPKTQNLPKIAKTYGVTIYELLDHIFGETKYKENV